MMIRSLLTGCALAALACAPLASARKAGAQTADERPATLKVPTASFDYERRTVEIKMRDGVKLHTVILIPRGAKDDGILLTRTPYNAEEQLGGESAASFAEAIQNGDTPADVVVEGGYIRVIQDVRGKYGSQGIYMMNPPLAGTAFNPTKTDDSTDAYDTIDWLVKNVKESNGRVGISGISYDGYLPLMALVNPHPALKVAVPMNPMVDGWRGDDWFHNGAFRQQNLSYIWDQEATRDGSKTWFLDTYDDYDQYMRAGSVGALAEKHGLDQIGFWKKIAAHPAYDAYWQAQAMDQILARQPLTVPTMLVHGLWDQEDIYGAPAVWKALKPKDTGNLLYMTMGPWFHGQEMRDGSALGNIKWGSDTALWWRKKVLAPFLAHYLKGTPMDVATVTAFQSGTNEWQKLSGWPTQPAGGPQPAGKPLYLKPGRALGFDAAAAGAETADYVSDPASPVTYQVRPNRPNYADDATWRQWLTDDQRPVSSRPDVLTFVTDALTAPVTIAGQPMVHLTAATSGTDADWVVKLIDVYPDTVPGDRKMGGYQLAVAMDIFRGRYRESLAEAKPIAANVALKYQFALPNANHVFLPGHRIMVQVQSSWFPLYDRNPQTFVPNIFFAKPADYVAATQKVVVSGADESFVTLPVVGE